MNVRVKMMLQLQMNFVKNIKTTYAIVVIMTHFLYKIIEVVFNVNVLILIMLNVSTAIHFIAVIVMRKLFVQSLVVKGFVMGIVQNILI